MPCLDSQLSIIVRCLHSQVTNHKDQYEAAVLIANVDVSRLGDYRLTAVNRVGRSEETIGIRLRRDKTVRERDSVHRPRGHAVTNNRVASGRWLHVTRFEKINYNNIALKEARRLQCAKGKT